MNRGIRVAAAAILVAGFCACGQTPSEPGGNAIAENRHGEEITLRFGDRAEARAQARQESKITEAAGDNAT